MPRLVVDTNIIMLDANNISALGADGTIVVLPETVLSELDNHKSGFNEINYQARLTGRLLASCEIGDIVRINGMVVTKLGLGDIQIEVVALDTYSIDVNDSGSNDQKIIQVAKRMADVYGDTKFMSNDVLARLRALGVGLAVTDFKEVDDDGYEFVREFEVLDAEVFRTLHKTGIEAVVEDHKHENFNYKFSNPETGQIKLATIGMGVISVLGKDTEKDLRRQDISPVNSEQLLFSKAIQDPLLDVVVCESLAGSGKTLLALSNSIMLVKQGKYDSILYVRASVNDVDDAEEVGFLPGLDEKFAVYLHPMHDSLDAIVRGRYKATKLKGVELEDKIAAEIDKLVIDCHIEATTTLGMRGRTYNSTIMIIDEVQNQSKSSLQKVITRVGKNCKLLLLGSNNQLDNNYMTKYTNGLSVILNACKKEQSVLRLHAVTLHKVVRGVISEWAEKLFSK